jgi:thiamine biosynthesis lipoprotein
MRALSSALLRWTLLGALAVSGAAPAARVDEARPLMGTVVEIAAAGPAEPALRAAVEAAYREMARLIDMMSHYDSRSVVSAINDAAGSRPVPVPPELMSMLTMARRISERSKGAFDITVGSIKGWRFRPDDPLMPSPEQIASQLAKVDYRKLLLDPRAGTAFLAEPGMRIDPGGVAKLYILDAGMRVLIRHGIARAMVNGGGDVNVIAPDSAHPWRIGVRDPRAPDALLGTVVLRRGWVVSSGVYERYFVKSGKRYHHILDPRTGYPAEGPIGVTLVSTNLEVINGFPVVIMVLGKRAGIELLNSTPGLDGVIVDRDDSLWMSPGFRARLRGASSPPAQSKKPAAARP